jgi:hypothetical protein
MPFPSSSKGRPLVRFLTAGLFLLAGPLSACWWESGFDGSSLRPYPVSDVHQPPRLLRCTRYRPPSQYDSYTNAVQVEFDVSANGLVTDAEIVEEGMVVSSSGNLGDPLAMARSCAFTPAHHWGRPVAVHMSMWFVW